MVDTSIPDKGKARAAQAQGSETERPLLALWQSRPIVVKVKKKKKRKYSRPLKGPQQGIRRLSRAGHRFVSAISSGFGKYRKKARRSSWKKRDGVLKDLLKNSTSSLGVTLRKSSKVPRLSIRSIGKKGSGRNLRVLRKLFGIFGR